MEAHQILRKAGALRNGAERGRGSVWHAVPGEFTYHGKALCGTEPAIMWRHSQGDKVTCPRCLKKIERPTG